MKLRFAILAVELLPPTVRTIGFACIGCMFLNSIFNVIVFGEGHFSVCLAFSLALTQQSNECLSRELQRANALDNKLATLKKRLGQRREGYNKLMKDIEGTPEFAERKAYLQQISTLRNRLRELELESKHAKEDRAD